MRRTSAATRGGGCTTRDGSGPRPGAAGRRVLSGRRRWSPRRRPGCPRSRPPASWRSSSAARRWSPRRAPARSWPARWRRPSCRPGCRSRRSSSSRRPGPSWTPWSSWRGSSRSAVLRAGVVVAGAVGAVVVTVGPGTRTTRLTRRTTTSRLTISRFTMTFGAAARAGAAAGGRDPASMTSGIATATAAKVRPRATRARAETARLAGADGADDRLLDRAVGEQEDLEGERPEDAADEQPLAAGRGDVGGPPEQEDARGEAAGEDFRDEARHDSLTCVGHLHARLKTRSPGRVAALDGRSTAGTVIDGPRGHRMRDAR